MLKLLFGLDFKWAVPNWQLLEQSTGRFSVGSHYSTVCVPFFQQIPLKNQHCKQILALAMKLWKQN
jgi:hypothetical protein